MKTLTRILGVLLLLAMFAAGTSTAQAGIDKGFMGTSSVPVGSPNDK